MPSKSIDKKNTKDLKNKMRKIATTFKDTYKAIPMHYIKSLETIYLLYYTVNPFNLLFPIFVILRLI